MSRQTDNHRFKADFILAIGIMVVAAVICFCMELFSPAGAVAVISVDGREVKRLPLDCEAEFHIDGFEGGYNDLCISGGAAYLTAADCPDRLCQSQGRIMRAGESIICLPHRVVIMITNPNGDTGGTGESEVDTIAQ